MFDRFPKKRTPLPPAYQKIYLQHYQKNRAGKSPASFVANFLECWVHKKIARTNLGNSVKNTTLEVGAGTLNHLNYENLSGPYDIIEPEKSFLQSSPLLGKVRNVYSDIDQIPEAGQYGRVLAIFSFEHICNLPEVVAQIGLHIEQAGGLLVGIPSEGTPLWRLAYALGTGIEFRVRYGLKYSLLMQYEHVNTAAEIEEVVKYFFADIRLEVMGLCRCLSLYQFLTCCNPLRDRCYDYLHRTKRQS